VPGHKNSYLLTLFSTLVIIIIIRRRRRRKITINFHSFYDPTGKLKKKIETRVQTCYQFSFMNCENGIAMAKTSLVVPQKVMIPFPLLCLHLREKQMDVDAKPGARIFQPRYSEHPQQLWMLSNVHRRTDTCPMVLDYTMDQF
jgi:hypothetical protein